MAIQGWFPTFVYYDDLQKRGMDRFNAELVTECHQLRRVDKTGQKWCLKNYRGGYTSYSSYSKLHKMSSTFMRLEKLISRHVKKYTEFLEMDFGGKKLEMTDCWVNIMPEQVVHGLHLHPLSCISGTYYVSTPKGCSEIRFEDPRLPGFMAAPPKRAGCSKRNQQQVKYPAKAGKVVLFESWLRHEVAANPSQEERISISFNYNWF